jgi:hypothetical protein
MGKIKDIDDVEKWRTLKPNFDFKVQCSMNSAPSTFKDIQTYWNNNVCTKFAKIRLILEREFVPGITREGWLALGQSTKGECDLLRQLMNNVWTMVGDRKKELNQQRKKAGINPKQAEEEAKKELFPKVEGEKPTGEGEKLKGDPCFIATAAYGTATAVEIDELRHFRDEYLRKSSLGNEFIKFYYENSPPIARLISEHEILRVIVREGFVDPVVKIVELTENYWSE